MSATSLTETFSQLYLTNMTPPINWTDTE